MTCRGIPFLFLSHPGSKWDISGKVQPRFDFQFQFTSGEVLGLFLNLHGVVGVEEGSHGKIC